MGTATSGPINGVNYYVANPMGSTNGIGTGTCGAMDCIQETNTTNFSTIFGALFSTMGWMEPPWDGPQQRASLPCWIQFWAWEWLSTLRLRLSVFRDRFSARS